jgi:hypothetical protein
MPLTERTLLSKLTLILSVVIAEFLNTPFEKLKVFHFLLILMFPAVAHTVKSQFL